MMTHEQRQARKAERLANTVAVLVVAFAAICLLILGVF